MYELIEGKVIHGEKLSRKLGFRTANINLQKGHIKDGVYKINIKIKKKVYHGIGTYLEKKGVFESHIFNFHKNIYGEYLKIIILKKIRKNKTFKKSEDLKEQIKLDIKKVKKNQNYVLTFGTFDILHPGHRYYLNSSRLYSDKLVTIIATDNNVKRFKGNYPENNSSLRLKNLKKLGISDLVMIGEESSPMKIIELYNPSVICLGYDQVGFINILEEYIKDKKLETTIIRIPPFKETIYKSSIIKSNYKL